MKKIYIVTFIITSGGITTESVVRFDKEDQKVNRIEAVRFHDSINMLYPNAAKIDSVMIKTKP